MTILIGLAAGILLIVFVASVQAERGDRAGRFRVEHEPDSPKSFGYKMAWLAVRTEDSAGLARVLGLDCRMAANWNSGIGTVYDDVLGGSHIYVTPSVDGWTFVIGLGLPHPVGAAFVDKLTPLLLSLSRQYRDVQYYFTYPLIDFFAWARAKDGKLVRAFAVNDEGVVWNKGRITKEERALGLRLFELRGVRERHGDTGGELVMYPTEDQVLQVARGWSLDPTCIEASSDVGGPGIIAPALLAWSAELRRKSAA
ncbi:MAG: hypothetical protein APF80_16235 [Alphaproteobacteria bacterium BRH_c36]|nr:MAG: hypothetical protein APF80_16235 [Alphaproteobacteria bacterium BRH_c36]